MDECPNCGEDLLLDFDECPACGKKLPESSKKEDRKDIGSKLDSVEEKVEERLDFGLEDGSHSSPETEKRSAFSLKDETPSIERDSRFEMVNLDDRKEEELMWIDEEFEKKLGFEFEGSWPSTYLCEDLDEFAEKMVQNLQLSDTQKDIRKEKEKEISKNTKGVNLPGEGFYLNGSFFLNKHSNIENIEDLLEKPRSRTDIISTVCHEKLGHGFIDMCTPLGKELSENNLRMIELAGEFDIDSSLTPDWEMAKEKWDILFPHMCYLQEGYATWVQNFMAKSLGLEKSGGYSWSPLKKNLPRDAYDDLYFLINKKEKVGLEDMLRIKHIADENEQILKDLGQLPRYILGYLIFKKLEACVGPKNVPHSVKIACSVEYQLSDIPVSDLERLVEKAKFNLDTRILKLSRLDLEDKKNEPEILKRLAFEKFNMPYGN